MRAPVLLTAAVGFLVACGGPAKKVYTPQVTSVGTPIGAMASSNMGPDGGTVTSADGRLSVRVPAGALSAATTLTVQTIAPEAPGGVRAWRLGPEGQTFAAAVDLVIAYGDDDVNGSAPEALAVGFQNTDGTWSVLKEFTLNATAKTLTARTTHFSDWSLVQGLQLRPLDPTVQVSETVTLTVNFCAQVEGGDGVATLAASCEPDELTLGTSGWAVNGKAGGELTKTGSIAGSAGATAVFTAPSQKPSPAAVTVSTEVARAGRAKVLLISNITIADVKGWAGSIGYVVTGTKTTDETGQSGTNTTFTKRTVNTINGSGTILTEASLVPGAMAVSGATGSFSESSVVTIDATNTMTTCGYISKNTVTKSVSGQVIRPQAGLSFALLSISGTAYSVTVSTPTGDMTGTEHTVSAGVNPGGTCIPIAPVDITDPITSYIPSDALMFEGMIDPKTPNLIKGTKTLLFGTNPVRTYSVTWQFKQ